MPLGVERLQPDAPENMNFNRKDSATHEVIEEN
jgi:hypothetical protein